MKFISVILTITVMLFAAACAPLTVATQLPPNPSPIEITANAVTAVPAMETATQEVVLPTVIGLPGVRPTARPVGTASPSGGIPESGITL